MTAPLMIAAITGNDSLLKRFIEAGADPSVRDYRNKSALDFAAEFRNHKCVEILTGVVKS